MGLGVALITFSPNTTIKSSDMNSNLTNINSVSSPTFSSETLSTTLGGADKVLATWTATDGKSYQWGIRSANNRIFLNNNTDSKVMLEIPPVNGAINPVGTTIFINASDPTGSFTVQTGDVWIKNS